MHFSKTLLSLLLAAPALYQANAFVVRPLAAGRTTTAQWRATEADDKAAEAVFVPPTDAENKDEEDDTLAKAESLGRGAAKVGLWLAVSLDVCVLA